MCMTFGNDSSTDCQFTWSPAIYHGFLLRETDRRWIISKVIHKVFICSHRITMWQELLAFSNNIYQEKPNEASGGEIPR